MAGINIPSNFDPNRIKKPASSEELGPVRTKAADAPAIALGSLPLLKLHKPKRKNAQMYIVFITIVI